MYQADLARFHGLDTQVLGISVDSVPCKEAWAKSMGGIDFPLLADFCPQGEVARIYGALRPECYSERAIFVVDKAGTIRYIDVHDMDEVPDPEDLFKELEKLP